MLYDLGSPPRPGSLLESVFMLLANRRQYQEFLKTRVIMEASLAPHLEKGSDRLSEAYENYAKAMLPYIGKVRSSQSEDEQKALEQWTNKGPLVVRPLWRAKEGARGSWKSSIERSRQRVRELEDARRAGKLRRIG